MIIISMQQKLSGITFEEILDISPTDIQGMLEPWQNLITRTGPSALSFQPHSLIKYLENPLRSGIYSINNGYPHARIASLCLINVVYLVRFSPAKNGSVGFLVISVCIINLIIITSALNYAHQFLGFHFARAAASPELFACLCLAFHFFSMIGLPSQSAYIIQIHKKTMKEWLKVTLFFLVLNIGLPTCC